ncbi:endonuclease/exonuclease/phosphatase family protein [Dyadobacter sp. CY345]|uniref:endonuclease/exonuclease/phosphatase family protein n=1 Tax=Dyadobacter sp. CY345 TaxID=2909335 RepID=UPI001F2CEBE2|nr:endonuclease/exonuclease/phosphatase family protein [Dyadobacter sp. CY345]MCF2447135.1 endonuclease/exonuclease/phosphatase family protein [Dyadobacter sp. CY345]
MFKCFAAYSLLVYALTYWVPTPHWAAGFLMMSLPVTIIINIIFVFIFLLVDSKKCLAPIFLIVLGSVFLPRTYQFGNDSIKPIAKKSAEKTFTVMNYNVYGFWVTQRHVRADDIKTERMKEWIIKQDADILCMPEFNNEKQLPTYRTVKYFRESGYPYYNLLGEDMNEKSTFKSLAIFSKFPIIKHKEESFEQQNGLMYVDVVIQKDTVRVIGVHLYSMSLQLKTLVSQKEFDGVKRETRSTLSSMKRGFSARTNEVRILEKWIRESPYPIIVCGDFNETPYSYFYGRTRALLKNAFEENGEGFGFTYNRIPWFIRIDNQFYDDKALDLLDFKTLKDIKYSDHNPSFGTYSVNRD